MNFDKEINRYNTNSLKYDFKKERRKPEDIIPMWVADMDFMCPKEVLDDLHERVDHGIFGYTKEDNEYFEAINLWYKNSFNYKIKIVFNKLFFLEKSYV